MVYKEINLKVDDAVDTIAKFFNDLISSCVPGMVLVIGLVVTHLGPTYLMSLAKFGDGVGVGLIIIGLLFAIGHVLLAVNQKALKPLLNLIRVLRTFDEDHAKKRQSFKWFAEIVDSEQGSNSTAWSFNDLRGVALSVSTEAALLGRRFMFISLLCSGVGTALVIIGIDYLMCLLFAPNFIYSYEHAMPWYVQAVLLFGTALLIFKQGDDFYSRAMTTPFSVAVAEIRIKKKSNEFTP